jgi:long-chain fatty acid transport protein
MKALICASLLIPSAAHAAGFAVAEQNAVAAGTAGAGAARQDDAGLAWYNPAALVDGGGFRAGLSLVLAHPSLEARAMDGSWSSENESSWSTPPHLDLSYAARTYAFGLSAGVPFGSGVTWPADWPGRHEIVRSQLEVFRVAPFAALKLGDFRLSAGVHVDAGRLRVARRLDFIDVEGDVFIDMDGRGVGGHAAAYWQDEDLAVGLVYRSRTAIDFEGGADFTAPDAFSEKTADQAARATMTLPDELVLGGRYTRGAWTGLLDASLMMWSVNERLVVDFANDATPDAVQENHWETTLALRGGGEWRHGALVVRAGAYYDPSPSPEDRLAPSSPDSSRVGASAGASYALSESWSVDAFAETMVLMRRASSNDEALAADYGGTAQILGFGVRYTIAPGYVPE